MLNSAPTQQDFAQVFVALPMPYLLLDRDLVIVAASDAYLQVTMTRREDIVGRGVFEVFPAPPEGECRAEIECVRNSFRSVLQTGRRQAHPLVTYAIPRPAADGGGFEERLWRTVNTPVFGPDQRVDFVLHKAEDITLVVRKGRRNAARLRSAVGLANLGVWEYDLTSDRVERTAPVDTMFGFVPGTAPVCAAELFECVHPEDRDRMRAEVAAALASPDGTSTEFAFRVQWLDGTQIHLLARGEVIRTRLPGGPRLIGVVMDVTAERERTAALDAALADRNRLLDEQDRLFKTAHHRLKNSLQLVSSVLQLQARTITDPAMRRQFDAALSRVRAIIIVHERIHHDNRAESLDISQPLRDLCEEIAASLQVDQTLWQITVTCDSLPVAAEQSVPLLMLVNELVTNAISHAYPDGRGGAVEVTLRAVDDPGAGTRSLRLTVADHGIGHDAGRASGSLGMRLIENLARQAGATLCREDTSPGHRVTLTAPIAT